ncbi:hypothetical protein GTCCBUS3UF5_6800 [Geobacillus thermoleovorans CCB_US3_UF5]|uniref:Uncharacterized protein n=3 Tax=Geobacillus TaxID=129337 RepID=A0A7U9J9D6_GEOTM|nr:hypothetical protein GTCCBUS3UF5_6800 [Geobacillus thermoleovorans CCB_US3_UF5]EQB94668.1 hypothetical protein GA8_15115 [Geobacillus sp. A8]ESU71186.1 hypothetical protein T260_15375 [Geobacillus sp. MAS1]GAD14689.1 hypothetical protein GBL_2906 [Geobacillus kaustophilus GBlys]GAJ60103.1 hypothetical protein B23_3329 [Geobacillus thermoleovorans B23]
MLLANGKEGGARSLLPFFFLFIIAEKMFDWRHGFCERRWERWINPQWRKELYI